WKPLRANMGPAANRIRFFVDSSRRMLVIGCRSGLIVGPSCQGPSKVGHGRFPRNTHSVSESLT
ncbi:MAG: hypothetical protein P8M80_11560, partial [Pirellulaceae bacterium]|nr:hypothetical protein [Pirellulaceae bacterium]